MALLEQHAEVGLERYGVVTDQQCAAGELRQCAIRRIPTPSPEFSYTPDGEGHGVLTTGPRRPLGSPPCRWFS